MKDELRRGIEDGVNREIPSNYANLRMFWRDAKTNRRDAGSTNGGGCFFGHFATNIAFVR
jgi:hypothetical protein